jgi:hypothetical protein
MKKQLRKKKLAHKKRLILKKKLARKNRRATRPIINTFENPAYQPLKERPWYFHLESVIGKFGFECEPLAIVPDW